MSLAPTLPERSYLRLPLPTRRVRIFPPLVQKRWHARQ